MKMSKLWKTIPILLLLTSNIGAQGSNEHLKKWAGKLPTFDTKSGNFFRLPDVARPLKTILSKNDYYYLTTAHTKEGPITLIDDYLQIYVCGSRQSLGCDNNTILVINLNDGSMYLAFDLYSRQARYFSTKGKFADLPRKLQLPNVSYKKLPN
jgi:hypothetical protein